MRQTLGRRMCSDKTLFPPPLSAVVLKCSPDAGDEKKARGELERETGEADKQKMAEHGGSPSLHQLRWMENPKSPSPARLRPSLSGLVEEDVPRLRVLGDVGGEAVKLLDGLGVDFLPDKQKVRLEQAAAAAAEAAAAAAGVHEENVRERRTSTMSSSNSSQKP